MATYIVTTLSDTGDDRTSAGSLAADQADGGGLSLREAVLLANASGTTDSITFDTTLSGSTVVLTAGPLRIASDVTISGDSDGDGVRDISLDANDASQVFSITGGTSTLANLTIENGVGVYGGGIAISGTGTDVTLDGLDLSSNSASYSGGGIHQLFGTVLTLTDSIVRDNIGSLAGGGLYSQGTLSVVNSLFKSNEVVSGSGGGGALTSGNATFINTTFDGNSASGSNLLGGALFNDGTVNLTNSTLSGNTAQYGGAIFNVGSVTLTNSIVLGNATGIGSEIYGNAAGTVGGNIVGGTIYSGASVVGATTADDVFEIVLGGAGVAGDNGGVFDTIALNQALTNPALDVGNAPAGISTDSNGNVRDVDIGSVDNGGTVDAGAVELQLVAETPSLVVTIAGDMVDSFDGETSLREAITFANSDTDASTVTFDVALAGNTLVLTKGELAITTNVTVDGDTNGDDLADISISGDNNSRILNVSGATTNVTVQSVILENGDAGGSGGGAIYGNGFSLLSITNSTIRDSSASEGGGIFVRDDGVTPSGSELRVSNTIIDGNTAGTGGGVTGRETMLTLDAVQIVDNTASSNGGGIRNDQGTLNLSNSFVFGNEATNGRGGGLSNFGGDNSTITASLFEANTSGFAGGGVDKIVDGSLAIENSTFANNTTGNGGGGGIYAAGSTTLVNSTISGNYATNVGGGLRASGSVSVANSIILGNSVSTPGASTTEVSSSSGFTATTSILSGTAADVFDAIDGATGGGQLADNGGTLKTIALLADATNPALDAGDDAQAPALDATGNARVDQAILANNGANVGDLGAVELQTLLPETRSLTVTITTDVVDQFDGQTSLREAIAFANSDADTSTIRFDAGIFASNASITLTGGVLELTQAANIIGDVDGDGDQDITIDGNGLSGVLFASTASADLYVSGVTITGGYSDEDGGGIRASADLTVVNSLITGNATFGDFNRGGGIYVREQLFLVDSTVSGNSTSGEYAKGGGISSGDATQIINSTISGNATTGDRSGGGGIYNFKSLTLSNSTIADNTTYGRAAAGGGVYARYSVSLVNSTVSGNSVAGDVASGGGIFAFGDQGEDSTLTNSIVTGNSAADTSGADDLQVLNLRGAVATYTGGNIIGTVVFQGAVDIGDTSAVEVFATTSEIIDGNGLATGIQRGVLADNGGTTETIALLADVANSALDAGDDALAPSSDALGNARFDQPIVANSAASTSDLGAVELQALASETPSLIVDTDADVVNALDGRTSLREAIGHLNAGTLSGTITFASGIDEAFETGGTITLGGSHLTLTSDVVINGDVDGDGSPDVTVDAGDLSRVFGASSGTSTLQSLTISGGDNSTFGGGIYIATGATLTLDRAVVQDNSATAGAGLFNNGGTLTLLDSLVTDNSTNGGSGGGIFSTSNGTTTLSNTTLEGNVAAANGGAIFGQGSTIELVNVTATGNSAGDQGGATFTNEGSLGLTNTLVIGNSESSGSSVSAINTVLDINNVLLVGNSVDIFEAVDLATGGGLLADNGGPVQTVALLVDPANAAAEAGDATLLDEATAGFDLNGDGDLLDTIATDAEGNTRIVGTVDLGATEIQQILGSVGGDTLTGSGNADTFVTGTGVDVVISGDGDDSVDAGADDDAVAGGGGNDTISGGSGDDLAVGGLGNDLLYGGDDDDQILPGSGTDTLFGGDGEDTVSYVDSTGPVTVDLSNNANNAGDAAGDVIDGVENIIGSSTNSNTLAGDANANTIDGGAADDSLNGGGGNDRLEGNGGADTLDGGAGDDVLVVDSADDVTDQAPGEGYDRVLSTASVTLGDNVEAGNLLGADDLSMTAAASGSWINGNAGNNTLLGQDGADRLDGNAGNDLIDGAGGNDLLEGGSGADTFVLSDGVDLILDFEDGTDLIDLTGFGLLFSDLGVSQSGANVALGHATGTLVINNVNIADLSAADFIEPAASATPIVTGTGGNDNLFESAGPVEIQGLGGNDLLGVFNGAATLVGGSGDDQYYVYDAATTITELAGEGTELARSQVNLVLADNVENGAVLGDGDVGLTGNAGANFLTGSAGANVLSGEAGTDRLLGLAGADTLNGGEGNDILQGGTSDGAADVFVFETGDGNDLITDFELGIDVIDLTATGLAFGDLTITGTTNTLIDTGTDLITVNGVTPNQLTSDQFELAP